MLAYLPLIQKILLGYMTKKTHEFGFSLNYSGIFLMMLAALMGFLAFLFFLIGARAYLETLYGVPASWLLVSAGILILTGVIYFSACYSKKKNGLINRIQEDVKEDLSPMAQVIESRAEPIKDHPIASVVLAALAGVLAGDKINEPEN